MNLNIVFAVDDRGFDMMAVAMYSVIKNNQKHSLSFTLFHRNISEKNLTRLQKLEATFKNTHINIVSVNDDRFKDIDVTNKNVTTEAYFRYLAPETLTNEDRALYMDYDMLCLTDLAELYETDLTNNYIGAVADYVVEHRPYYYKFKKGIGFGETDTYINSGLLLFDLKKLRKDKKMDTFWSNLQNKQKIIPREFNIFADQTVTNLTFKGKIQVLDPKFNVFTTTLEETKQDSPVIIHFTGPFKPFTYRNDETTKYDEIYFDYYDEAQEILGSDKGQLIKNALKKLSQEASAAKAELETKDKDTRLELESTKRDVVKYRSEAEMWRHESARLNGELLELRRVLPLLKQLFKSLDAAIRRRIERLNKHKVGRTKDFSSNKQLTRNELLASVRKYDLETYYTKAAQSNRPAYKIVMSIYDTTYKIMFVCLIAVYKLMRKVVK